MIRANFNAYNLYTTDELYQWDKNQDLSVNGLNLTVAPEIHFTNMTMERALVRQATLTDGVVTARIPNSFLQVPYTIKAYIGVYEGETFKIIEEMRIPVIARSKPDDYTVEGDEEIYSFNKLENDMTNFKNNISAQVEDDIGTGLDDIRSEVTTPYNFKGSCLSTALPTSNNDINDTWYCTDLKYRKTWNGTAWYQSSLNESDYEDDISEIKNKISEQTIYRPVYHNIFDKDNCLDGRTFYRDDNDNMTTNEKYFTSPFIKVDNHRKYFFNKNCIQIKQFDLSKQFLDNYSSSAELNDHTEYVRFSSQMTYKNNISVYEDIGILFDYDTYMNLFDMIPENENVSEFIENVIDDSYYEKKRDLGFKNIRGMKEFHWNLVSDRDIKKGAINSTGNFVFINDNSSKYRCTGFIPVEENTILRFMYQTVYGYDENKTFLSQISQTEGVATIPSGCKYVRCSMSSTNGTIPKPYLYVQGYNRFPIYNSDVDNKDFIPMFENEDMKEYFKLYLGVQALGNKKFVFIGDSFSAPGAWQKQMCNNLMAISIKNHAISGGAFSSGSGVPKTAYEQAQEVITNNESPDYILITLGTNDANNQKPIGDVVYSNDISDFDLTTYSGGMQACINHLKQNLPDAIVKVGWTPAGGLAPNNNNIETYIDRMKKICLMYGIDYVETRTCGITQFVNVYADCYESGVHGGHPTGVGQTKIGNYMSRMMLSNL